MNRSRLVKAEAVSPGLVRLTFMDGFAGVYDLSGFINRGPAFAPLKDSAVFEKVSVGELGLSFGWNLDEIGKEIDFGAEAARADLEAERIKQLAEVARKRILAAE